MSVAVIAESNPVFIFISFGFIQVLFLFVFYPQNLQISSLYTIYIFAVYQKKFFFTNYKLIDNVKIDMSVFDKIKKGERKRN